MKHVKCTDALINKLNQSVSNFYVIFNNKISLPFDDYLKFLVENSNTIESIDTDSIKEEFWILFNEIGDYQKLKKIYDFKLRGLYEWHKSIETYLNDNPATFYFEVEALANNYLKLKKYEEGEISYNEKQLLIDSYITVCTFLLEIYFDYSDLFEQALILSNQAEPLTEKEDSDTLKNKEFTNRRQVLAMYFIFNALEIKNIDKTILARFIQFLTGKSESNIYKILSDPFKGGDELNSRLKDDLNYVKEKFDGLGLEQISKNIVANM